ncbi:YdcF family protein [Acinetobacter defluvii]|uniref:YdcF family protein n=1 Tax=Acinetobacter defluvii TaxID=1871111 RepID=A0A2S2FD52_9GAMM|nr:YdcF family protein [Acinetobacter defluvii]AWL28906.1 YdcF family protein [Acinetobacter defluvii]
MKKQHWMVKTVRRIAVLFVFLAALMVFWYTPFYSNLMVRLLNTFVPVEVNQLAAQSQQNAALSDSENLEPGSKLWIARQAYLKLMEQEINSQDAQGLTTLQLRYKALQEQINDKQKEKQENEDKPLIPLVMEQTASDVQPDESATVKALLDLNSENNKALMDQYLKFLKTHPVEVVKDEMQDIQNEQLASSQVQEDIANIQSQTNVKNKSTNQPYAIVVLGGGLTLDKNQKDIIVNAYTRVRLEKTIEVEKKTKLPIVLSGVESPYMQAWLKQRGVDANLLENRSMNTCENTRFSSLLLQKKGGAPTVLLITDRYHMPRTRRLFALNGIETIPIEAAMPTPLTEWQPSQQNYNHSRRANYETLATIRDVLFGSSGCREVP